MLARARRSACSPAPLVGSVAANVKTAGSDSTYSFMGARAVEGGLHLNPGSRCARRPGIATMLLSERARPHILLNRQRVRLCLLPRQKLDFSECGAASRAASSMT